MDIRDWIVYGFKKVKKKLIFLQSPYNQGFYLKKIF